MRFTFAKAMLVAAAATTIFANTALADPPGGHTPTMSDIIGACDASVARVFDGASANYNSSVNPPNSVYCYGPGDPTTGVTGGTITTKPGCTITRPNGASAGISALLANQVSTVDNTTLCLDFVSAERGRQSGDQGLVFLPFTQENLKYATSAPTTSFPGTPVSNAPQSLTAANLATIYSCGLTGHTVSKWSDFGGVSSDAVQALIPQTGAGTRMFFENSIGVTEATIQAGVNSGCLLQIEDDDPLPIRANADRIGPFAVPLFNTVSSDAGIQLNTAGFVVTHVDYNVVRVNASGGIADPRLVPFFGDGGVTSTGWICSAAAQSLIQNSYGFSPITLAGHSCGVAE